MQTPAVWLVLEPRRDAGATLIAEALIRALRQRSAPAVGIKPIDIDCPHQDDHDLTSPDGERLWLASQRALPPLVVAPYRFPAGAARDPVAAATAAGLDLTLRDVLSTIEEAAQFGGPVVVLGPSEAEAPFVSDGDVFDLARAARAQVVLVVDEQTQARAPALEQQSTRHGLTTRIVTRTAAPTSGALHVPPDEEDPSPRLAAWLDD